MIKQKSRFTLYQLLFAICIYVPYLDNYELTFAVWSFSVLVTITNKYSLGILKQLLCFATILGLAIIVLLFKEHELYYIIRDFTYLVKPVLGLLIGYQLCKKFPQNAFRTIAYTGFGIALIHLFLLFWAFAFYKATTINDIRYFGGFFSDFEVYALILLLFHKKFELNFSQKRTRLFTIVIAVSAFMYLARTNFIQFFILFFALKGYFQVNKRSVALVVSAIMIGIIGYSSILILNPKRTGPGMEAFLYKIKIIPEEAFKTKINRDDWKEFNDNYRSYENIMTVRQVSREGFFSVLFGQGLGSKVDLKQKVWLGDMELRYISILHNGFMTIFLKSGLLGLFIYLISIFLLFRKSYSEVPIIRTIDLLLLGTGIFLFFSNWVFMGVYNLLDSKSIFIGTIICYKAMTINSYSNQIKND